MVESPGPSLPALIVSTTSGCAASTESTMPSIRACPSSSLPTPKLRLSTSGSWRASANADGVVHRPEHAAGGRDAALRAVRDLEAEQLRARRHPVEARARRRGRGPRRCRRRGCRARRCRRTRSSLGVAPSVAEVGGDVDAGMAALGRPAEALAAREVVVDRPLARERAVAVGVGQEHPAVGRADHDDRQRVAHGAVAVEVGRGRRAERQLGDGAGVVRPGGVQRDDPAEPAEPPAADLDRVARRRHPRERDRALAGEVAQVEDLRAAGRRW